MHWCCKVGREDQRKEPIGCVQCREHTDRRRDNTKYQVPSPARLGCVAKLYNSRDRLYKSTNNSCGQHMFCAFLCLYSSHFRYPWCPVERMTWVLDRRYVCPLFWLWSLLRGKKRILRDYHHYAGFRGDPEKW